MDDLVVGGFLKNGREMVVGEINAFNDKLYAHLRILVPSAAEEGEWIHTEKGVAVELPLLPAIRDAVHELEDVASNDRVVASIPVGNDEVRIGVQPFKGNTYVYVRRFYRSDGEWHPSPKGVSLRTEHLDELVELVDSLADAAGQLGSR